MSMREEQPDPFNDHPLWHRIWTYINYRPTNIGFIGLSAGGYIPAELVQFVENTRVSIPETMLDRYDVQLIRSGVVDTAEALLDKIYLEAKYPRISSAE